MFALYVSVWIDLLECIFGLFVIGCWILVLLARGVFLIYYIVAWHLGLALLCFVCLLYAVLRMLYVGCYRYLGGWIDLLI